MICIGNPGHRFKFLLISGGHIGAPKRYTNMAIFAGSFHAPSQSFVWRRQIGVPLVLHHLHRRSQYEANRGTRLGKILPNTVDFYFFYQTDNIRRFHTADFVQRTVCSPRLQFLPGYGPDLVDVFYLKNNSVLARFRNLDEISARFWPPTFRRSRRDPGENFVLELSSCSNKGIVSQQVSNGTKHPNTNSNYLRLFFSCRD